MRTTILPSMLEIIARNYSFRNRAVRLYELGKVYFKRPDGLADEPRILSLGAYGDGIDFYGLKGAVEELLAALRVPDVRFVTERDNPSYHPGRCARVLSGTTELGVLGQIHPRVAENYGVGEEIYCAELAFETMHALRGATPVYSPLPRFPATTRDLSVVCAEDVTVGALADCIRANGGTYLEDTRYVGVYRGLPIPPGQKSVTFALTLRAQDQTLTVEHAEETMQGILAALEREMGAVIR